MDVGSPPDIDSERAPSDEENGEWESEDVNSDADGYYEISLERDSYALLCIAPDEAMHECGVAGNTSGNPVIVDSSSSARQWDFIVCPHEAYPGCLEVTMN